MSFDADVERKFRAFIKNLDVDNAVINNHFRNIVKVRRSYCDTCRWRAGSSAEHGYRGRHG